MIRKSINLEVLWDENWQRMLKYSEKVLTEAGKELEVILVHEKPGLTN